MAGPSKRKKTRRRRRGESLENALLSLDRSRGPLFREMERIGRPPKGPASVAPHRHCTRKFNRMRITDLEAIDIARAFREKPHLLGKLPEVYARLAKELPHLKDSEDPQAFDCPLLDGERCMVHTVAKPIACLAWNPGREYSSEGWHSFQRRDKLNRELFGDDWQLKAIPLQIARFLEEEDSLLNGPCGSTLRKRAMARGEIGRAAATRAAEVASEKKQRRGRRGAARHEKAEPASRRREGPGAGDRRAHGSGRAAAERRKSDQNAGDGKPGRRGPGVRASEVRARGDRATGGRASGGRASGGRATEGRSSGGGGGGGGRGGPTAKGRGRRRP